MFRDAIAGVAISVGREVELVGVCTAGAFQLQYRYEQVGFFHGYFYVFYVFFLLGSFRCWHFEIIVLHYLPFHPLWNFTWIIRDIHASTSQDGSISRLAFCMKKIVLPPSKNICPVAPVGFFSLNFLTRMLLVQTLRKGRHAKQEGSNTMGAPHARRNILSFHCDNNGLLHGPRTTVDQKEDPQTWIEMEK